jgi:prepilin signal peptidase PulO-like enzyme (type II secretory pathway)
MILTIIFIFGAMIGSFLNVVILRFGTENSIVTGGSKCPSCGKGLKWFELVPILSWIFLLGRCSKCKKSISFQYPLVELATGVLFVMQYVFFFDSSKDWIPAFAGMTMGWAALALLVAIFVYDLYHKIIPDTWSYSFGILGLIYMFLNFEGWDLIAPLVFFIPFYLLWRISNGAWIGLGDGKLAFGIGAFLGLVHGLSAIILSFWIGAIFAIALLLIDSLRSKGKNITMKSEVAFGPFMIIGFLVVYFLGIDVTGISGLLNAF